MTTYGHARVGTRDQHLATQGAGPLHDWQVGWYRRKKRRSKG